MEVIVRLSCLLLPLVLACSESETASSTQAPPASETVEAASVVPGPPGDLACAPWPAPATPPPLLDRPESQRVSAQLTLMGLEGSCIPREAGGGTTGNACEFTGRGIAVSGQLLYNPAGAGDVHDNTQTRGPWRTWITTHEAWGGFLDVTDVTCAEQMRDRVADGGVMAFDKVARRIREMGWKALCGSLDEHGRGTCKLVREGDDVEGQLVFLRRPESASAAEESRLTEKGQARWVHPDGVIAITLGSEATTQAVRQAVFPDAPEDLGETQVATPGNSSETTP